MAVFIIVKSTAENGVTLKCSITKFAIPKHNHTIAIEININISLLKKSATDNVSIMISVLNENNTGLENI